MKDTTEDILQALRETAYESGQTLLRAPADSIVCRTKSSFRDLLTQYDTRIQAEIIGSLSRRFPGAAFIAEEQANAEGADAELLFVIDPLDGTTNFVKSLHYSCVSIACYSCGKPLAGAVCNPYADELFSAAAGRGAALNGAPIRVSDAALAESLAFFGTSPYNAEAAELTFAKLCALYKKCLDVRRMGAAALDICHVACGRAGLFFEARLSLWDYAAAAVILREAGGTLCDFQGAPLKLSLDKSSVLAGSERTIRESGLLG